MASRLFDGLQLGERGRRGRDSQTLLTSGVLCMISMKGKCVCVCVCMCVCGYMMRVCVCVCVCVCRCNSMATQWDSGNVYVWPGRNCKQIPVVFAFELEDFWSTGLFNGYKYCCIFGNKYCYICGGLGNITLCLCVYMGACVCMSALVCVLVSCLCVCVCVSLCVWACVCVLVFVQMFILCLEWLKNSRYKHSCSVIHIVSS